MTDLPFDAAADGMRGRPPAYLLMLKVVAIFEAQRVRSRLQRILGVRPIPLAEQSWLSGAIGELDVAARLARLPEGWTVFHSLPVGRGESDIDHVVVGPGGVFPINTKRHAGAEVRASGGAMWIANRRLDHLRNAELEGSRVSAALAGLAAADHVRPMILLVDAKSLVVKERPRTVVLREAPGTIRWLRRQRAVLSASDVAAAVARLDSPATWRAVDPIDPSIPVRFAAARRAVEAARLVRIAWMLGLVLAFGIALLVAFHH